MKRITLALILISLYPVLSNAQMVKDTVFTYGADMKPNYKKVAFIEKVRFTSDSSYACILYDAKTNVIRRKLYYTNEVPSASWEYFDEKGNLTSTRNYVAEDREIPKVFKAKSDCIDSISMGRLALEFNNYILRHIMYPQLAVENSIQGKVIYKFVIDRAGKLDKLSVIKSSSRFLTEEAIRLMTSDVPESLYTKLGSADCVASYTMPLIFRLQE